MIDPANETVLVVDAQRGLSMFAVRDNRLLIPRHDLEDDFVGDQWVSFSAEADILDPAPYSPERVAEAFEFGSRRCRPPSADAASVIADTMHQLTAIRLCGGGFTGNAFADGRSVAVRQQTSHSAQVSELASAAVVRVEDIPSGDRLTEAAQRLAAR